jgi:hypothetical protein
VDFTRDDDGEIVAVRIVTERRGSWRYQDAYRIAHYRPRIRRKTAHGKSTMVWMTVGHSRKYSMPQLRRMGYAWPQEGSLSQRPVAPEVLSAMAVLEESGAGYVLVDWR